MYRPLALLVAAGLIALAADPTPAQQPKTKPKLTFQATAEQKVEIKRHAHVIGFSPDGKQLAVGEENVHLFDLTGESAKEVALFNSRVGFGLRCLTFSRDGKFVIFGGADNTVRVWNVDTKTETAHMKEHKGDVLAVAMSPDGKQVVTGSNDQTAIVWGLGADGKLTEQTVLKAEDKYGSSVRSVAFAKAAKGVQVVVTAGSNGTIRSFTTGAVSKQVGAVKAKNGLGDTNLTPNPAGTLWAFNERQNIFMITSAGAPIPAGFGSPTVGHKDTVRDLSFSPDGKLLASASHDGTLYVWDVATKAAKYNKTRPGRFTSVAFSPYQDPVTGDTTLAASMEDGTVHIIKLGYR
ncbi:MAG TPA: beta-propeller fold lactonase family protein [Urbifossiella sp.]|jgi:WD40 repeat protein|nr:beta-propeller fold lactonase family protein [Urbifossiella sp.]